MSGRVTNLTPRKHRKLTLDTVRCLRGSSHNMQRTNTFTIQPRILREALHFPIPPFQPRITGPRVKSVVFGCCSRSIGNIDIDNTIPKRGGGGEFQKHRNRKG